MVSSSHITLFQDSIHLSKTPNYLFRSAISFQIGPLVFTRLPCKEFLPLEFPEGPVKDVNQGDIGEDKDDKNPQVTPPQVITISQTSVIRFYISITGMRSTYSMLTVFIYSSPVL